MQTSQWGKPPSQEAHLKVHEKPATGTGFCSDSLQSSFPTLLWKPDLMYPNEGYEPSFTASAAACGPSLEHMSDNYSLNKSEARLSIRNGGDVT